jgi:hypothetical protein
MRIGAAIMFKECPMCGNIWKNREAFLTDPNLVIIGYQARFEKIKDGLFLFNHACQTTLAVEVMEFDDLYKGPKYDMSLFDTDECSELCLDMNNLDACGAKCKYAYVRDIIQIIKNWPKIELQSPVLA